MGLGGRLVPCCLSLRGSCTTCLHTPGALPRWAGPLCPTAPILRCAPVAPSLPQISSVSPCSRRRRPRAGSRTGASRSRSPSECGWMPPLCAMSDARGPLPRLAPSFSCSFYKANHIQKFSYSRPFKKGPKDPDNEFAVREAGTPLGGAGRAGGAMRNGVSRGRRMQGRQGSPIPGVEEVVVLCPWEGEVAAPGGRGEGRQGHSAALPAEHVDREDDLRNSLPPAWHPALVRGDLHHHGEEGAVRGAGVSQSIPSPSS